MSALEDEGLGVIVNRNAENSKDHSKANESIRKNTDKCDRVLSSHHHHRTDSEVTPCTIDPRERERSESPQDKNI